MKHADKRTEISLDRVLYNADLLVCVKPVKTNDKSALYWERSNDISVLTRPVSTL